MPPSVVRAIASIIQGLAEPDKSFGGYPVITELAGSIAQPGEVINFPDQRPERLR